MDTRKSSFRLLLVLTCAVSILLLAIASASATSTLENVGCKSNLQSSTRHDWEPLLHELSHDDIIHSLEVVPQAAYGETVMMKQTLRNVSDEGVQVALGGSVAHDFIVTTPNCEYVWNWSYGMAEFPGISFMTLEPGAVDEFPGEWEQVDNRGEPVPPGTYLVRGLLDVVFTDRNFVTEALELKVLPKE